MISLVTSLSSVLDLMNKTLVDHHKRVAYIALKIAQRYGLGPEEQNNLIIAGSLHDIGAISLQERLDLINYEQTTATTHAEQGYRLLNTFSPFQPIAPIVRFHHHEWDSGAGRYFQEEPIPDAAHILHLADRTEILIDRNRDILSQKEEVQSRIQKNSNRFFHPGMVDAFLQASTNDAFWLDLECAELGSILENASIPETITMDLDRLEEFGRFFSRVIDLRSRFTATHSSGVAAVAQRLSEIAGFNPTESRLMRVAGYLHDLGKVSIPVEILEKNGKLTDSERLTIRRHTYYTYRILNRIPGLEQVNVWASLHHERLNGTGYPFGYSADRIPRGSRILAIADIVTALSEKRPYRDGGDKNEIIGILTKETEAGGLDPDLVKLAEEHFDEINVTRSKEQTIALRDYERLFIDYKNTADEPMKDYSYSDRTPKKAG